MCPALHCSLPATGSVIWKTVLRFGGTVVAGVLGLGALYFTVLCNGISFENRPAKVGLWWAWGLTRALYCPYRSLLCTGAVAVPFCHALLCRWECRHQFATPIRSSSASFRPSSPSVAFLPCLQFISMTAALVVLTMPLAAGCARYGVRNAYFWVVR